MEKLTDKSPTQKMVKAEEESVSESKLEGERKTEEVKAEEREKELMKKRAKRKARERKNAEVQARGKKEFVEAEIEELKKHPFTKEQIHNLFHFFEGNDEPKLDSHIRGLISNSNDYLAQLKLLIDFGVAQLFSSATKSRILAAVYTIERQHAKDLIDSPLYAFAEVLKAMEMIDAPRKIRRMRREIRDMEEKLKSNPKAVRKSTLAKRRTAAHHLERDMWPGTSLNRGAVRFFKEWFQSIDKNSLQFYLLHYSVDAWKPAFDLLHLKPADLQLSFFQDAVFENSNDGESKKSAIPKESLVAVARSVDRGNITEQLKKEPQLATVYSFLRKSLKDNRPERKIFDSRLQTLVMMGFDEKTAAATANHFWNKVPEDAVQADEMIEWLFANKSRLSATDSLVDKREISDEAKGLLAESMPLDEAIWWYHELVCPKAEAAIQRRLEADSKSVMKALKAGRQNTAYGKLMERMLYFRESKTAFAPQLLPHAENMLKEHKLNASGLRLVVAGDASGSMEVAIKSSTILGSLLSLALDANLIFFNEEVIKAPCQPRSALDVLKIVEAVPAKGATSMAAALWPYYKNKMKFDIFILVSDEGENQKFNGYSFAELWEKYLEEINPKAQVQLVSFLHAGVRGAIKDRLNALRIEAQQHRLDPDRPDTSKFDAILGQVALVCREHKREADKVAKNLLKSGEDEIENGVRKNEKPDKSLLKAENKGREDEELKASEIPDETTAVSGNDGSKKNHEHDVAVAKVQKEGDETDDFVYIEEDGNAKNNE